MFGARSRCVANGSMEQLELNFSGWNCSKRSLNDTMAASKVNAVASSCKASPSKQCYRTHGHSVGSVKDCPSALDCCAACQKTSGCAVYSLDPSMNNTCWLLDDEAKTATKNRDCLSASLAPVPSPPSPPPPGPPSPTPCTGHWGCFVGPSCTCDGRVDSHYNCV